MPLSVPSLVSVFVVSVFVSLSEVVGDCWVGTARPFLLLPLLKPVLALSVCPLCWLILPRHVSTGAPDLIVKKKSGRGRACDGTSKHTAHLIGL